MNLASSAALAAASRALRGYDDELAEECLAAARKAWDDESQAPPSASANPWEAMFRQAAERNAALQLLITTGDERYSERFDGLIWTALNRALDRSISAAVRAQPHMDADYGKTLKPYVDKYREQADALFEKNPYGVPIRPGGWAGNEGVISWNLSVGFQLRDHRGVVRGSGGGAQGPREGQGHPDHCGDHAHLNLHWESAHRRRSGH